MNLENLKLIDSLPCGETYYTNPIGRMQYTEGVNFLAENAEAYWLIDAIASYQPDLMRTPGLQDFQVWELAVDLAKHSAVLTCRADTGEPPVVTQEIEFTTFPLPSVRLWVEGGICIMPCEH